MRNRHADEHENPGEDSFLDIVANIVGILIILVMVVGVRASYAPPLAIGGNQGTGDRGQGTRTRVSERLTNVTVDGDQEEKIVQIDGQIAAAVDQIASLQSDVKKLARRVVDAEQEESMRDAERTRLQAVVNMARVELEKQRNSLNVSRREQLDLQQDLTEAQSRLEELSRQQFTLETAAPEVETIESLPTPLAKTVIGDEIHIRLRRGRVAVVPLEPLLDLVKIDAEAKLARLDKRKSLVETIGPIDGFRLRYRLVRKAFSMPSGGGMQHGTIISLDRWELLPVVDDLGVSVEQALLPRSKLRQDLAGASPDHTTVTIWTYPGSFAEFRSLKKSLFDLGYTAAARPMPDGIRIGGSPQGTKSSAQ